MTPRTTLLGALVLCASITAQDVTSPKGFLNKEANSNTSSFSLGTYRDGHFQFSDGTHVGTPMLIKGTAYRHGNYVYTAANGGGRSWTNVQIHASECNGAMLSTTFTSNPTTTPTRVFSAAVNWATQIGKPSTFPAGWSMSFPFQTNWSYSGNQYICLDYQFSGGTLANNKTWTSAGSANHYLDSQSYPTSASKDSTKLGAWGANVGCNDRGVAHTRGAEISTRVSVYSADYSPSLRNKIVFTQSGRYFPGSRPAMTVIGLRSLTQGFRFAGITCNNVHIDLSLPVFFIPSFVNSNGSLVSLNLSANNPGLAAFELVSQVIWSDSVTGNSLLSNAAATDVPTTPPGQPTSVLYVNNATSKAGWRSPSRAYQPVVRYKR